MTLKCSKSFGLLTILRGTSEDKHHLVPEALSFELVGDLSLLEARELPHVVGCHVDVSLVLDKVGVEVLVGKASRVVEHRGVLAVQELELVLGDGTLELRLVVVDEGGGVHEQELPLAMEEHEELSVVPLLRHVLTDEPQELLTRLSAVCTSPIGLNYFQRVGLPSYEGEVIEVSQSAASLGPVLLHALIICEAASPDLSDDLLSVGVEGVPEGEVDGMHEAVCEALAYLSWEEAPL